jgi:pseudaminic acid synthase
MKRCVEIAGRRIGPGEPVYVIAELSANHLKDLERAEKLLRAAVDAGADAVKLQTYTPDTLTLDSEKSPFQVHGGTPWDNTSLYELYRGAYMPWEWQPKLKAIADGLGVPLFSSAFDASSVEFLVSMGVPAFKVASFELVDVNLIEIIAKTGKPVLLSTGMATLGEIHEAMDAAARGGANQVALLKCNSAYPAPAEGMHLRTIPDMAREFQVPVGLSDHTIGNSAAIAAVALGASIIEKHLTLARGDGGADSSFSAEPAEFKEMVAAIRATEKALGAVNYGVTPEQKKSIVFRRSLRVTRDIKKGEQFAADNVRLLRPVNGLHPRHLREVIGRRASRDIERGTPMSWDLVENGVPDKVRAEVVSDPKS